MAIWPPDCIVAHSVFLLFISAVLSEFKLVYMSWLISTDSGLYQSFVFLAEFKRFTLDLTALFSAVVLKLFQEEAPLVEGELFCGPPKENSWRKILKLTILLTNFRLYQKQMYL